MKQGKQGKNVVRVEVRRTLADYELEALMDKLEIESYLLHQARQVRILHVPTPQAIDHREVG